MQSLQPQCNLISRHRETITQAHILESYHNMKVESRVTVLPFKYYTASVQYALQIDEGFNMGVENSHLM